MSRKASGVEPRIIIIGAGTGMVMMLPRINWHYLPALPPPRP